MKEPQTTQTKDLAKKVLDEMYAKHKADIVAQGIDLGSDMGSKSYYVWFDDGIKMKEVTKDMVSDD